MESSLEILARAFFESEPRIAVFDSATRKRAGLWTLPDQAIPIEEIISTFDGCEAFRLDEHLLIPLHELHSAELTGSYVVYVENEAPYIGLFDFGHNTPLFLSPAEFGRVAPALHVRYWYPEYRPPETPSYLTEYYAYSAQASGADPTITPAESDTVGDSWFADVKLFVERERDARRKTVREKYAAIGGNAYVDAHEGITGLVPAGRRIDEEGAQVCMLEIPATDRNGEDPTTLSEECGVYPGNEVLIDAVDRSDGFPVEGEVVGVDEFRFDLRVTWSTSDNHSAAEAAFGAEETGAFRVVPLVNPVPFDRQRAGIEAVEDDERKRSIVLGTRALEFDPDQQLGSRSRALNQYQRRAIRRSLGAADLFCIHGPPGTGKSRTLRQLIRESIHRGEKVLACAHSNQAIDQLLVGTSTPDRTDADSLHASAIDGEFVLKRAGNQSSHPVVNEYYRDVESWEANLVGATTNAAYELRIDEFDLVVIDEAGQCGFPSSMLPFSRGKRLVLAGDHQQLPPFTSSESDDEEHMEISFFEHVLGVYGSDVSTMLRKQYRMNEAIAAFPDEWFYDGKLTHGQRNRTWTIRELDPLVGYHVTGTEERTPTGSFYNETEAAVVAAEVRELLQHGVPASQIGVITPYSGQVGKIVQALDDPELKNRLKISTVDAFQGSERDAIIVSFVRSNPTGHTGFLTFPQEGPRRLNVALTRAKKRLTVIGNWETLGTTPPHRSPSTDASDVYAALAAHLRDTGVLRAERPQRASKSR